MPARGADPLQLAARLAGQRLRPEAGEGGGRAAERVQLAEAKKREVDAFLTAAVQSGKITEQEKTGFAKLAENDFETVKGIIESKPAKASASLKDLQAQTAASTPSGRENWTYLEWMKKDPEGLKRMKTENPTEFERLQNTLKK